MDFNKLVDRIKNILLTPKTEWPVIAAEPDSIAGIYKNYIVILAAIPAVIALLNGLLHGNIIGAVLLMIVSFALELAVCYVMMLIVDTLAPSFGAEKNQIQALKTVAYTRTPGYIVSILSVLGPVIGSLVGLLAGIYSVYLLYLGLQETMRAPKDRAIGYTAVIIVVGIVIALIIGAVVATLALVGGAAIVGAAR